MGVLTLVIIILITLALGNYALKEGARIEKHKKFIDNLEKFDKHGTTKRKGKG
jgi:hypothetical protein